MVISNDLSEKIHALRGPIDQEPDASIVIPVNAQGDLDNILKLLDDIVQYEGPNTFEIVLAINNYPPDQPPNSIDEFREMGINVVAEPNVRKPGVAVPIAARMVGVRQASTEFVLLFDADCRIPNASALLTWYVKQFRAGADLAYSHVDYYGLRQHPSIRARMLAHHWSRWVKRVILRIPTTRGSNFALKRDIALEYYDNGYLADDINVGPTIRKFGGKVVFSNAKELTVLTSGRVFTPGWHKLYRYLLYRLRYNIRVVKVGTDVAKRTKRENDPVKRYVDNVPVRDDDQT